MTPTPRTCGSCTLCCKVMAVEELGKPAGKWCSICSPTEGCYAYAERPKECRDFACLWLRGEIPEEFKPDRSKAVFTRSMAFGDVPCVEVRVEDERSDVWREGRLGRFIANLAEHQTVVVACSSRTLAVGSPDAEVMRKAAEAAQDATP